MAEPHQRFRALGENTEAAGTYTGVITFSERKELGNKSNNCLPVTPAALFVIAAVNIPEQYTERMFPRLCHRARRVCDMNGHSGDL